MKTVLVAIDLPSPNGRTLDTSIALARSLGARLVALHVVRPPLTAGDRHTPPAPSSNDATRSERAALQLSRLQRRLLRQGVTVETRHVVGQPGHRIVELASLLMASYVVIGAHDRGSVASFYLGNAATQVVRESLCPVVVVPPVARAGPFPPRRRTA